MSFPALVLLPGLDGTGKLFNEFIRELGARWETQVIGYPTDVPLGYEDLEERVRTVLPDRPFILLAESFSGPIGIRIAARAPPGLVGVVLCGTFAKNPFPWLGWARPLAAFLPLKSLPRWIRSPLMWGSMTATRAPVRAQRAIAVVSGRVVRRRIAALLGVDAAAALMRITVPVLVLYARGDRIVPVKATQVILSHLPTAQVVAIDGPAFIVANASTDVRGSHHRVRAITLRLIVRNLGGQHAPAPHHSQLIDVRFVAHVEQNLYTVWLAVPMFETLCLPQQHGLDMWLSYLESIVAEQFSHAPAAHFLRRHSEGVAVRLVGEFTLQVPFPIADQCRHAVRNEAHATLHESSGNLRFEEAVEVRPHRLVATPFALRGLTQYHVPLHRAFVRSDEVFDQQRVIPQQIQFGDFEATRFDIDDATTCRGHSHRACRREHLRMRECAVDPQPSDWWRSAHPRWRPEPPAAVVA